MLLEELREFASDFETLNSVEGSWVVQGISAIENPLDHQICFLKSRGHIKKIGRFQSIDHFPHTGLIVDRDLFSSLEKTYTDDKKILEKAFGWIALASDLDALILSLAEKFYRKQVGDQQHFVDGRQMGTVEIHPSAQIAQQVFIGERVKIGAHVEIYPGAVIQSDCEIGEGSQIFPNVTLYPFVRMGKGCRIHSGVSLGADGFGYQFLEGRHQKIWHLGGVKLGDDVEIGANSAIDRGTFTDTVLGNGVKIDNLVQIGHNCHLGNHVIICGQSAVGGSVVIEDYAVIAGQVAVCDNVTLGQGSQIAGNSAIGGDVPAGAVYSGYPAKEMKSWIREIAYLKREAAKR